VLLTRAAGQSQPVTARLALGTYEHRKEMPALVEMTVAGRSFGAVALSKKNGKGDLQAEQVTALLEALHGSGDIEFTSGPHKWRVSSAGASAVLLRMDEAQGRIGTVGAVVRKGPASEERVLPAVAKQVVRAAAAITSPAPSTTLAKAILRKIKDPGDRCDGLTEATEAPRIWRLADHKVLVSIRCWEAGYNQGYGFWVANDQEPFKPVVVATDAADFDANSSSIFAVQKGRGFGDCVSTERWVWDGTRFVHAEEATSGACRLVTPGGTWALPSFVTDVVEPVTKEAGGQPK
jgi:hypothetical protein